MPYIPGRLRRTDLRHGAQPETAGELNFKISDLVDEYLTYKGGINYDNLNEVLGVLTAVQLEVYRRLAAPYEDEKIQQNGDVFTVHKLNERKAA